MRKAAFLRSINVGGRRVSNAELIAIFEGLGLADVAAYQAAGNLVFSGDIDAEGLAAGLEAALGYAVPVLLRTGDELGAAAHRDPFTAAEREASAGKVQVSLLQHPLDPAVAGTVLALETAEDRLRIQGRELYWLPVGRTTDSVLDLRAIHKRIGLQTTRTQGTLVRMHKRFFT